MVLVDPFGNRLIFTNAKGPVPLGSSVRGIADIYAAGGRIFVANGMVLNPDTGAVIANINTGITPSWAFNEDVDEFYILSHDNVKWTLKRFSISTLAQLAEIPAPVPREVVTGLVQFVPNKFAYKTANFVTVFTEPSMANTDIALSSSITPSPSGTSAEPFVWNLTITNRGTQTASNIAIVATIHGPDLSIKPVEAIAGNYPNPFTRIVPTLAPGESHTLNLAITSFHGGRYYLTARAERYGADPDFANNSIVEEYSFAPEAGLIRTYMIAVSDIDFDKVTGRLWMAPMMFMQGMENSLVSLDLSNYLLRRLLSLQASATAITAADSGHGGFALLDRVDPNLVWFDTSPPRTSELFLSGGIVFDILARPGTTNVLVTSTTAGTYIYTNGVPSLLTTPSAIAFDHENPNRLFVYHDDGVLSRFDLNGDTPIKTSNRLTNGPGMYMAAVNGRVVFADGRMADQETLQLVGTLPGVPAIAPGQIAVDTAANRICLYFDGQPNRIEIYDATTFTRIGGMSFDGVAKPGRFRAHNSQAALVDRPPNTWESYNIRIFEFPATNLVDLAVNAPVATAVQGAASTFNITASNNSPWPASNVSVEVRFPTNFVFDSVAGTSSYELIDRGIRFSIPEIQNGSPESLGIIGAFSEAGTNAFDLTISSASPDLNTQNNQVQFTTVVIPLPIVTVPNPYIAFNEGAQLILQFNLSHAVPMPVSFAATITNGSATVEQTLQSTANLTRVISFNPNSTNAFWQLSQRVIQNTTVDGARTLIALLSNPTNVNPALPNLTLTIIDNEGAPGLSVVSMPPQVEGTTNRTFNVRASLNRATTNDASFKYSLLSSSAIAGVDFAPGGDAVVIPAGVGFANIPITILADDVIEPTETLLLEFTALENVQLLTNYVRISIADRALPPTPDAFITGARIEGNQNKVHFTTTAQGQYRLLRALDVTATEWTPVGDVILHSTGIAELADPRATADPTMFYRVERR